MVTNDVRQAEVDSAHGWWLLGLAIFALYGFATAMPRGDTWGIHALAFLPPSTRIAGLLVCALLLLPPLQRRVFARVDRFGTGPYGCLWPAMIAVCGFVVFYSFPVRTEVYGDTRTILRHWTDNANVPATWRASLFSLQFQHNDAALTQVFMRSVAHTFSLSIEQTFRLMSGLAGALWLGVWTQFVRTAFAASRWNGVLLLAGCVVGANQIFFGHVETYAFVFLVSMLFLLMGYLSVDRRGNPWVVGLLFMVAVKAHAVALCFLPALIYVCAVRLSDSHPGLRHRLTWRATALLLVAPALATGAALYAFYFKAVATPYTGGVGIAPPVFLPLFQAGTPRNYSLLSAAHLVDLGNVLLLVGMPVLALLAGLVIFHRRQVRWEHPTVVFTGLALLFPLLFMAGVNPLLSMPRDWDLFALLAGPLLLLLAAILSHSKDEMLPAPALYGTVAAFGVFSLSMWMLNSSPPLLSPRLEQVGEHVFRTYHTSASYLIGTAQGMEPDTLKAIARREASANRLATALVPNDQEYAHLVMLIANTYRARGDRAKCVQWVERAVAAAPQDLDLSLNLADCLLWSGDRERAAQCVHKVLQRAPGQFDALVLGAIIAAEQHNYDIAVQYLTRAERAMPGDKEVPVWKANMEAKRRQYASAATMGH